MSDGDAVFTQEEWERIYEAIVAVDDEFGFKIGEGRSLGHYQSLHPVGSLTDYYAAAREADEAGQRLRMRIAILAGKEKEDAKAFRRA